MNKYNDKCLKVILSDEFSNFIFNANWKELKKSLEFDEQFKMEFINAFKKNYSENFEFEEIEMIFQKMSYECELRYGKFTPNELIAYVTEGILLEQAGEIIVDFDEYFNWIGLTNKMDEVVLVIYYCAYNFNNNIEKIKFTNNICHNERNLNQLINREKAENHMHLNAGALNFQFNLFSLLFNSSREEQNKYINRYVGYLKENNNIFDSDQVQLNLLKLIIIKDKLISHIIERKSEKKYDDFLKLKINEKSVAVIEVLFNNIKSNDYGEFNLNIPLNSEKDVLKLLNVERRLLFDALKKCHYDDNLPQLVMQYVYLRKKMENLFIHTNTIDSFGHFKVLENNKDIFFSENKRLKDRHLEAIMLTYKKDAVNSLEYRTTFKTINDSIDKNINLKRTILPEDDLQIGNIIHYIKEDGYQERNLKLYDQKFRVKFMNNKNNTGKIKKLFELNEPIAFGIDTANYEMNCRPEVFASIFRSLRLGTNKVGKSLYFTYHVGEVYKTLLSGIRAIDEVIEYYPFTYGDRLGHAIALGIQPRKYYNQKNRIFSTYGDNLDNLIWLYTNLVKMNYSETNFINMLRIRIDKELLKIQEKIYTNEIGKSLTNSEVYLDTISIEQYYDSMVLRSDNPEKYKSINNMKYKTYEEMVKNYHKTKKDRNEILDDYNIMHDDYKEAYDSKNARKINNLYHYNLKYNKLLNEVKVIDYVDEEFIKAVEYVQQKLREKVDKKGIGIEVNISSNYLISNIEKYIDHPLFIFTNQKLNRGTNNMLVSVCTDDAGLFGTSLYREYSIIAKTLIEEGIASSKVHCYIEHLIEQSQRQNWL